MAAACSRSAWVQLAAEAGKVMVVVPSPDVATFIVVVLGLLALLT